MPGVPARPLGFELLSQKPWPADNWMVPWYGSWYAFDDPFYYLDYTSYDNSSESGPNTFNRYSLWKDACRSNDSVNYDCYSSCNGGAFDSLFTLETCASIVLLIETNATRELYTVTDPSHVPIVTDQGTHDGAQQVVTRDLEAMANETSFYIWQCLSDLCQDLPDCDNSSYNSNTTYPAKLRDNATALVYDICSAIPLQLDSDIGGIGVYISYWIHACSILFLFIMSLLLKGVAEIFLGLHAKGKRLKIGAFADNRLASLKSAMGEFHKSQCYFTIAINIAAIKVFRRGGLDPKSLEQLYNNYVFLKIIAISGYLPVTLTLWNLHIIHKTHWFLIFLSIVSITFAIGTLGVLGDHFAPDDAQRKALDKVYQDGGPESCQNKQPSAYCFTDTYTYKITEDLDLDSIAYGILGFCLTIVFLLIIGQVKNDSKLQRRSVAIWRKTMPIRTRIGINTFVQQITSPCHKLWAAAMAYIFRYPDQRYNSANGISFLPVATTPVQKFSSVIYSTRERIYRRATEVGPSKFVYQTFKVVIYCLFLGLFGYYFSIYLKTLKIFASKQAYTDTWSFGQVVALLVWVPPIVEYIHCELSGIPNAMDHRLFPPYHVTKQPTDDRPSDQDAANNVQYGHTENSGSEGKIQTSEFSSSSSIPYRGEASSPTISKRTETPGRSGSASEETTYGIFDRHNGNDSEESRHTSVELRDQGFQRLELDFDTEYHSLVRL